MWRFPDPMNSAARTRMSSLRRGVLCVLCGLCGLIAAPTVAAVPAMSVGSLSFDAKPSASGLVVVRTVAKPTLAALDSAAWIDQLLRQDPESCVADSAAPGTPGALEILGSLQAEPPSATGTLSGLAFSALRIRLAEGLGITSLAQPATRIEGARFSGLTGIKSCQEFGRAWVLPETGIVAEVEFQPAATLRIRKEGLAKNFRDRDGDGRLEGYVTFPLSQDTLELVRKWVLAQYKGKALDSAAVLKWAQVLASNWYPSLNTDIAWTAPGKPWPEARLADAFPKVKPTVVIRGNPLGTPIWLALQVKGIAPVAVRQTSGGPGIADKRADRNLPANYQANQDRIASLLANHGGSWDAWDSALAGPRTALRKLRTSLPTPVSAYAAPDGWLFFGKGLDFTVGGDLGDATADTTPIGSMLAFQDWLQQNEVNVLVVIVPEKADVLADLLTQVSPGTVVNPWYYKWISDAQSQGIEVMDLYTPFLSARKARGATLFQKEDTHWNGEGLRLADSVLARRIREYDWYPVAGADTSRFSRHDTLVSKLGDLVERLSLEEQSRVLPETVPVRQVLETGKAYKAGKGAPIVLVGDSFTGVFESAEPGSAGIGSLLAASTGLDVETITSWGGGSTVRSRFAKFRATSLGDIRLVVYLMTARELREAAGGWPVLSLPR